MPVHDWTRVDAGIFHAFRTAWLPHLQEALNQGLLPDGFYALAEQHAGLAIADILTLNSGPVRDAQNPPSAGTVAIADAPPKVARHQTVDISLLNRQRTLAIRHVSGHELVAMIEIVSPANKDRARSVRVFAEKAVDALEAGVHLLIVDLLPPGPHDPQGMHAAILRELGPANEPYDLPADQPLTLASYSAALMTNIYIEQVAPGATLPEMPLFLDPRRYINVPLEATYLAAYKGMPAFWRDVLEKTPPG